MFRKVGIVFGGLLPFYGLRRFYYRFFLNYKIDAKSRIGMFNYIDCKELTLIGARIGFLNQIKVDKLVMNSNSFINNRNRIKNLNTLFIKENGLIGKGNFIGGSRLSADPFVFAQQNLFLGKYSEINRHNYFDILREVFIGDNVVFGGEGSEIWTHGFDTDRNMLIGGLKFGDNIFIGSKCIFTKGIEIADNVTITSGSVIYKSITESGLYSTHQIVKIR